MFQTTPVWREATSTARLFPIRYQGHVSAALVLGGVDCTGSYLHTVYPHGIAIRRPVLAL